MSETVTASPESRRPDARDSIHDLVTRLGRGAATISAQDPNLSRTIGQLTVTAERPENLDDPRFRTRVSYALQDMEKLAGPISSTPPALRQETDKLAATAPGLQNDRLRELVAGTKSLSDSGLIRDIRETAFEVSRPGRDQAGREVQDRVEALENRVRLAQGPVAAAGTARPEERPGIQDQPASTGGQRTPGQSDRSPGSDGISNEAAPGFRDRGHQPPPVQSTDPGSAATTQERVVQAQGPGLLNLAWGAISRHREQREAESDRAPTPIAQRSERHESAFQQMRDQAVIQGAERSQRAALDSLQAFANGPGSNILGKIQEAAKSEPGGMQAVVSEMRDGGRYSSLRSQFNADMVMERGMAASYEKLAGNLQQYGADRAAVDAIGVRRNTGADFAAKFEKLDAEIGKTTSMLPSKADGKSVMDDLSDKLREVLDRAVQAVRSVFTRSADAGTRTSSGPSPSP